MDRARAAKLLFAFSLGLLVLGVAMRASSLAFPDDYVFDEPHFVENARRLQRGEADANDHPPFGKLLIVLGVEVFGDGRVGHRASAALFGALLPILSAMLARRLFGSRRAAVVALGLVAADGFFVTYARAALLDGVLTFFLFASLVAVLGAPSRGRALLAGTLVGMATSVKLSGLVGLAPLVAVVASDRTRSRRARWAESSFATLVALVVFASLHALGLAIGHRPAGTLAVARDVVGLVRHHAALMDWDHPFTSSYVSWLLPLRPIPMWVSREDGVVRVISSIGNPLAWVASSGVMLVSLASLAWRGVRDGSEAFSSGAREGNTFVEHHRGGLYVACVAYVAAMSPWFLTHRDSYVYHYLPSYGVALVVLAGFVAYVSRTKPRLAVAFLACVFCVGVFYAPVWTAEPLDERAALLRWFLPTWR